MSLFLDNYIRGPIDRLVKETPPRLPKFVSTMSDDSISITVGDETVRIVRRESEIGEEQDDETPDDIGDTIPG